MKINNGYYITFIKNRVTMPDLLRHYGFEIGRGNRIACPFHNGKNKNLGFKDDFYHCFVCGASGDLIKFARDYFGLDFENTVLKLNYDFALGLPIGKHISSGRRLDMAKSSFEKKKKQSEAERERKRLSDAFWLALDELVRIDTLLVRYKPKKEDTVLHPLYADALKNIEYAKYALGCAEKELIKFEHDHSNNT